MGKRRKTTKPNIIVKKCVVCGAQFYAFRSTAKYCSDACKTQAYLERKKLEEAKIDLTEGDKTILESGKPESGFTIRKRVQSDTEEDFRKLAREIQKIFEQIESYDILGLISYRKRAEQIISEYEKRFNTTIEVSKKRFPNVNFKF